MPTDDNPFYANIKALTDDLENKDKKIKTLEETLSSIQKSNRISANLSNELESSKYDIKGYKRHIERVEKELNELKQENNVLRRNTLEYQEAFKTLKSETHETHDIELQVLVDVLKEDISTLKKNNDALRNKLNSTVESLMQEQYKNKNLTAKLKSAENENINRLKDICVVSMSETDSFLIEVQKQEIDRLAKENDKLNNEIYNLKSERGKNWIKNNKNCVPFYSFYSNRITF